MKIVTFIPVDKANEFIETKRLSGLRTMPQLQDCLLKVVSEEIENQIGYKSFPVACVCKFNNKEADLSNIWEDIPNVLATKANSLLFEMQFPEDMILSIEFEKLLSISTQLKSCSEEIERELVLEDLRESLRVGGLEGVENVVAFIPFLDLNRCKFYALVNEDWDLENVDIPGVEQKVIKRLEVF